MSNITDLELILTNVSKQPENFEFSETVHPFRSVSFKEENMENSSKNNQKTSKCYNGNTQKEININIWTLK